MRSANRNAVPTLLGAIAGCLLTLAICWLATRRELSAAADVPRDVTNAAEYVQFQNAIRRHFQRPTDPQWSAAATTDFVRDLSRLLRDHRDVRFEVDCRDGTCVATFTWPDYELATSIAPTVATAIYDRNCRQWLMLPSKVAGSFRSHMLFECG